MNEKWKNAWEMKNDNLINKDWGGKSFYKTFNEHLTAGLIRPPTTSSTWATLNSVCRRNTVASKGGCRDFPISITFTWSSNVSVWESPWRITAWNGFRTLATRDWSRFVSIHIKVPWNHDLQVLSVLNECFRNDSKWDKVQHEWEPESLRRKKLTFVCTRCIKCLKAIMNNKVGLKNLFEHKEALTLLAR